MRLIARQVKPDGRFRLSDVSKAQQPSLGTVCFSGLVTETCTAFPSKAKPSGSTTPESLLPAESPSEKDASSLARMIATENYIASVKTAVPEDDVQKTAPFDLLPIGFGQVR